MYISFTKSGKIFKVDNRVEFTLSRLFIFKNLSAPKALENPPLQIIFLLFDEL